MEEIYVFGCGEYFDLKRKELGKLFTILAFVDNAAERIKEIHNCPVYLPQDLMELPEKKILIMASRQNCCEMLRQLLSIGIATERILSGINLAPALDCGEEMLQACGGVRVRKNGYCFEKNGMKYWFSTTEEYRSIIFKLIREENTFVKSIALLPIQPISRAFGRESGEPIDRYYIEGFLNKQSSYISGTVGEIGESTYTRRFGKGVKKSIVFHLTGRNGAIPLNLETGKGVLENSLDCLICTQTLQFIYDLPSVVQHIYRLLKPSGVVLVTASGISQISISDDVQWSEYWRFTKYSLFRLFAELFGEEQVETFSYGNVKTATAFLYGLCQEDLGEDDFYENDSQYPVVVTGVMRKEV